MIGLYSYPRSGSHWIAYIIRNCFNYSSIHNRKKTLFKEKKNPNGALIKCHGTIPADFSNKLEKLILVVRNPKECIVRNLNIKEKSLTLQNFIAEVDKRRPNYAELLKFYKNFKGPKMIVYYEDALIDINKTLLRLAKFLELDKSYVAEFKKNLVKHIENSKKSLKKRPVSEGKINYHASTLSSNQKRKIDQYFIDNYRYLTTTYLKRYFK